MQSPHDRINVTNFIRSSGVTANFGAKNPLQGGFIMKRSTVLILLQILVLILLFLSLWMKLNALLIVTTILMAVCVVLGFINDKEDH